MDVADDLVPGLKWKSIGDQAHAFGGVLDKGQVVRIGLQDPGELIVESVQGCFVFLGAQDTFFALGGEDLSPFGPGLGVQRRYAAMGQVDKAILDRKEARIFIKHSKSFWEFGFAKRGPGFPGESLKEQAVDSWQKQYL